MLKKPFKTSIIVLLQASLLVGLALLLMPVLIQYAGSIQALGQFLLHYKIGFLLIHGLFYLVLFFIWPHYVNIMASRCSEKPSDTTIAQAQRARFYLVGVLLLIECLNFWR